MPPTTLLKSWRLVVCGLAWSITVVMSAMPERGAATLRRLALRALALQADADVEPRQMGAERRIQRAIFGAAPEPRADAGDMANRRRFGLQAHMFELGAGHQDELHADIGERLIGALARMRFHQAQGRALLDHDQDAAVADEIAATERIEEIEMQRRIRHRGRVSPRRCA